MPRCSRSWPNTAAWTPTMPRPGLPISQPTDGIFAMSTEVLDRPAATQQQKPESPVEVIKKASRGLRGTLVESLADPLTGAIRDSDTQLIKFHGSYMQDDRDIRAEREHQKLEPAYSFMIRTRLPGGVCTPQQWLALSKIARTYGSGTLRLTTRQAFQLHGVIKK